MEILLVSTFPPARCGVAAYAAQTATALRDEGHSVRVLTWEDGQGDLRLPAPPKGRRVLDILPHCHGAERVIFQYMPAFYLDGSSRMEQVRSRLALRRLFREVPAMEVVVHELPWYPERSAMGLPGRLLWQLERLQWKAARKLCFHNDTAVATFRERFRLPGDNATVVAHDRHFRPNYLGTRDQARQELGLTAAGTHFVSVGFITAYKGYELVIDTLRRYPDLACEYHIVGSLHPAGAQSDVDYLARLQKSATGDPRVRFHLKFVDDVGFDRWVTAADSVLLPYRSSTSSSVLARCHLLGVPAVTTRAGGLLAELRPQDRTADDERQLAVALREFVPGSEPPGIPTAAMRG